jgi:ribosome-associated toxin RatA of RatAB toxin-antitoxin module
VLGAISEKEAIVKYGVSELQQIKNWIKKYSSQINYVSKNIVMKETEQSELATILQQKKELEKVLEEANLRIIGLDTLIDVAEKQFNIEIRKKAGTKQ